MPRQIIIDTDPGQDDAVAILLALASPEDVDVRGIVAVAGNVGLKQNALNALKVVELSGRTDVPVFAGCDRPLKRKLVTAEHVHGVTGLDGPDLPDPHLQLRRQHGVDFIMESLEAEAPGQITICALGPLTNVATVLTRAPHLAAKIKEIVLMGGAYFEGGNITPTAEFNFYVDPQAAEIVFRSGIAITQMPLDVTHQVLTTTGRLDRLRSLGNASGTAVSQMLGFSERFDLEKYQWAGAPLHDPCVIAWLIAIARYRALDWLQAARDAESRRCRHEQDLRDLAIPERGPEQSAVEREGLERLNRCLRGLQEEQRRSVLMAYYEGYSHSELAQAMDAPLGTVKAWVRRGLARLRACLEQP